MYQQIRKDWKNEYKKAQRLQSISAWEEVRGEWHPSHSVSFHRDIGNLRLSTKAAGIKACRMRILASKYALLLNKYKVKEK